MHYLVYRISSNSLKKKRLENLDKTELVCDTISKFQDFYPIVIADNCSVQVLEELQKIDCEIIVTNLGNSRSLLFALKYALLRARPEDTIYFCEDDYWHQSGLSPYIDEGLTKFDYITLYDNPDKYAAFNDYRSPSRSGNLSEWTQVVASTHGSRWWRLTGSTTMTFVAKYDTLKEDLWLFEFFLKRRSIPPDMLIWHGITRARYKTKNLIYWLRLFFVTRILTFGRKSKRLGVLFPSGAAHLEPRAIPTYFKVFE